MRGNRLILLTLCAFAPAIPAAAQQAAARRPVTAEDYARAERYMGYNTATLVSGGSVRPNWLPGDRFWYRNVTNDGAEYVMVDPARRTRARAFDHARLAAALSRVADTTYDAMHLPTAELSSGGDTVTFSARGRRYACDMQGNQCTAAQAGGGRTGGGRGARGGDMANAVMSPDSTKAAFIRDYNLWMRTISTGQETQLTTDGVRDFSYALDNAGWTRSDRAVVTWSPDSKMIATYQQDERNVGEMFVVQSSATGHPTLERWKYPLAGDSVIQMIQRVVIHVDGTPRVVRLQMAPDPHRSSLCDHIVCAGRWADVEWSPDGTQLIFVSTARDHRHEWLRVADPNTGTVREVFDETDPYFLESGFNRINWHALPATHEVVWYSERTDWGHLYLYDLATGRLKNAITSGTWKVLQVLRWDEANRTIYFTAAGREGGDPYFRRFYSVKMDGSRLTLLTPEVADHEITLSPSGQYFIDTWAQPDVAPVSVLRDLQGRIVTPLERADISRLLATGWRLPVPITVKARDGRTDLYGLMYRPSNFDSTRSYPIINHIYPGPQTGSVGSRQFSPARGDNQALAELGFIVVEIDAMGTPMRSHSFQAAYYGNMGDNGLPDQVAGMRELAQRHSYIDLNHVGIWGHSGGGFATAAAMLRHPDFFHVGISEAGNHDQRQYEDDWGEKWSGLVEVNNGASNYDDQANQNHAGNLRGKLMLMHGATDNNVPPYNTELLVNALMRANKDFDQLMLPNRRHGFAGEPYVIRRRWDYFVKNLLGVDPPEYELHPPGSLGARPAS